MREKPQRPVDLARTHGLSTQAVRNYEAAAILPPAGRTGSGYRTYTSTHALALTAFLALARGHGHQRAAAIMQAVNREAADDALALIDAGHAELLADRGTLHAVRAALGELAPPAGGARRGETFIGPLAGRLGVRAATLRKWEAAGLVRPRRDRRTGYRVYGPADVRDAEMVRQLRRGGYPLERIAPLMERIRRAGGVEPLEPMLRDWQERLSARGRAMLAGAAALDAYLTHLNTPGGIVGS
jgi:DNA-binding transcriptional MerR regulator